MPSADSVDAALTIRPFRDEDEPGITRATNASVVAFYRALGYVVEERISMGKQLKDVTLDDRDA